MHDRHMFRDSGVRLLGEALDSELFVKVRAN